MNVWRDTRYLDLEVCGGHELSLLGCSYLLCFCVWGIHAVLLVALFPGHPLINMSFAIHAYNVSTKQGIRFICFVT